MQKYWITFINPYNFYCFKTKNINKYRFFEAHFIV